MSIAVARATNLCLRGTRMKNHSLDNRLYLWDEEGLCRLHNQHFWFGIPFCLPGLGPINLAAITVDNHKNLN